MELFTDGRIPALHDACLAKWYADARPESLEAGDTLESIITTQHFCNVSLWDLEDDARRTDVDDHIIAKVKRGIDGWNQRRNDLVEIVDQFLLDQFDGIDVSNAQLNSETAGIMVDRMSILSLKIHHMGIYAETKPDAALRQECADKQAILKIQRADLLSCAEAIITDFQAGRRYFKSYKQFKAYNDPRLNPKLATD
ncbi:MAG: DUF4254 domain-containing protein [Candidatus Hydrogenedentota bacterium]